MSRNEIGIGLIGYSIGKVHTHSWLNLRQFYSLSPKLVAVCGEDSSVLSTFAKHYGYSKTYTDWKELIEDPEVTIIDNCAPPQLHREICIMAAEKEKAVICENPLARTALGAYNVHQAMKKSGQVNMTAFNKRFFPATQFARELVKGGRLGKITHAVGTYYKMESPTGVPTDLRSHLIDLMRFVVGDISSVCGATQSEDSITGCLRFESGAVGTMSVSRLAGAIPDYLVLEVYGTGGSFKYYSQRPTELDVYIHSSDFALNGFRTIICSSKAHPLMKYFWPDQGSSYGFEQSFISEIAHFLSAVEKSQSVEPLGASFYDGYLAELIGSELALSAADGNWHAVKPEPS